MIGCATSVRLVWRRPLQTVMPSVHKSFASGIIERALNADTTLAELLRTLFREQGVTIASFITAFGFIVSTIVLAIQTGSGGVTPASEPLTPGYEGTVTDWVKKQLKTLAVWLETLARKATAALPGVIAAIVSWLLETAGSVAVWLAEHLWAAPQRFLLWSPRLRFIIARGSKLWQNLLPRRLEEFLCSRG